MRDYLQGMGLLREKLDVGTRYSGVRTHRCQETLIFELMSLLLERLEVCLCAHTLRTQEECVPDKQT